MGKESERNADATGGNDRQMIYEILGTGIENATTGKDLCRILDLSSRELTEIIAKERRDGKPICASNSTIPGYYIPANKTQMKVYCDRLMRRAFEIHRTRSACYATIEELPEE